MTRPPEYAVMVMVMAGQVCPHFRIPSSRLCLGCRESIEYEGTGLRECASTDGGATCGCSLNEEEWPNDLH